MLAQARWYSLAALFALGGWAPPTLAEEVLQSVRVADSKPDQFERLFPGTSHAHPGICVGPAGTVVVVHYVERAGLVLISRSTDGGRIWNAPQPVPDVNCKC
jgi:hypothetical protein